MEAPTTPRWTSALLSATSSLHEPLAPAAFRLAEAGVAVFPCKTGGKEPLTAHGFKEASADLTRVAAWWRRFPDANIGLPTGAVNGVDVVDVDVHGAASGYPGIARAREARLLESWAWCVRTPSGGLHVYFPHPAGMEQRSWQSPLAHVDFRGDGGYVVAPPSRIEADGTVRSYEVIAVARHEPGPFDAVALRRFLDPAPALRPTGAPGVSGGADPDALASVVFHAPVGGRNSALFWAACRMVEARFDYDSTVGALGRAAVENGLGEREAERTVASAFRRTGPRAGPAGPTTACNRLSDHVEDGLEPTPNIEAVSL